MSTPVSPLAGQPAPSGPIADAASVMAIHGDSSSIRFALLEHREPQRLVLRGKVDRVGLSDTSGRTDDEHARRRLRHTGVRRRHR
jgi:acetate kinase